MALSREQFAAVVGYQGAVAVVDRKLARSLKGLSPAKALEQGYFRQAFALALFDNKDLDATAAAIGEQFKRHLGVEDAKRLLGIHRVPSEIQKTLML